MLKKGSRSLAWLFALSLVAVACGDDDDSDGATGGGKSTGGTSSGGKASGGTSSGGAGAKGGTTNGGSTGGTKASGGTGTGGGATGGTTTGGTSTGGTSTGGVGGVGAEGGMPEGGTAMGGGGGVVEGGSAGAPTGGTAGAETGGSGGMAGSEPVDGGAGGSGGEPAVEPVIVNSGFETWDATVVPGWTEVGEVTASDKQWSATEAHTGNYYLNFWKDADYEVTVSQIVSSVPNGNYSLSIWQQGGAYTEQYVFARGYNSADTAAKLTANTTASSAWVQIVIPSIPVTSGQIEIGVYSKGANGNWSHFDDVTLTKVP